MTDENKSISLAEVFDDITARFFANLPRSEVNSSERMFVQLTEAHWFFQDFFSDRYAELPHLNFRQFCEKFFQLQPLFAGTSLVPAPRAHGGNCASVRPRSARQVHHG